MVDWFMDNDRSIGVEESVVALSWLVTDPLVALRHDVQLSQSTEYSEGMRR